jgi:ABC-type sugar transport system ATPase subunit
MSVRDNMGFALKLHGANESEIDEKVKEAARILDLDEHLDRDADLHLHLHFDLDPG